MSADAFQAFNDWRRDARAFLQEGRPPDQVYWNGGAQSGLFDMAHAPSGGDAILIPKEFIALARTVSCHSDAVKWSMLYTALWRIRNGEKHLLALSNDPLVRKLRLMEKAVRRDAHKAKAFIRFRRTVDEEGGEHYIAWHRPDHDVVPLIAGFFGRRFSVMRWTVLTPMRALHWNGQELSWGEGLREAPADIEDRFEDLWRTYYRSIFNPARIKLAMMRREMPVRYWDTMPETRIIQDMLKEAPDRVVQMLKYSEGLKGSAADFFPERRTLESLREAARSCQACPLFKGAICTVFGAGPARARIMVVGEQPGDEEDNAGTPFVGPAGQMLDQALRITGVFRKDLYMTNAVKHFKFKLRGTEREHRTPDKRESAACRPWLMAEIEAVKPKTILTLGVTAGRAMLGAGFSLKTDRGRWHDGPENAKIRCSYHPAAILRAPGPAVREELFAALCDDIAHIKAA